MEKYRIIETIGKGSFGEVTKAQNTETGDIVAIKKMKQKFATWEECMSLRELKPLRKLQHKNIVKLKEVLRVQNELSFVFEHVEQDIYKLYEAHKKAGKRLPESLIRSIFYQLTQALAYMHKHGYFHRDLKPENILFSGPAITDSKEGVLKLIDFGLAREIRSRPPYTEYVATRWYRAPELLLHSNNYNSPVDIFALGCIIAELFMFKPLFNGSSEVDQLAKICSVLGTPSKQEWTEGHRLASLKGVNFPSFPTIPLSSVLSDCPPEAIQLIAECLRWDASKRPTASKILQHPYFRGIEDVLPMNYLRDIDENQQQQSTAAQQASSHQSKSTYQPSSKPLIGAEDQDDGEDNNFHQKSLQQQQATTRQRLGNQYSHSDMSMMSAKKIISSSTTQNTHNNDETSNFEDGFSKPPLPFSQRTANQQNQQHYDRVKPRESSGVGNYADFLHENPVARGNLHSRNTPKFDENSNDLFSNLLISSQSSSQQSALGGASSDMASGASARSRTRISQNNNNNNDETKNRNTSQNDILGSIANNTKSSGGLNTYGGLPQHPRSYQQVSSANEKRNLYNFDHISDNSNANNNSSSGGNNFNTNSLAAAKNSADILGRHTRNLNSAVVSAAERNYFSGSGGGGNNDYTSNSMNPLAKAHEVNNQTGQSRNYYNAPVNIPSYSSSMPQNPHFGFSSNNTNNSLGMKSNPLYNNNNNSSNNPYGSSAGSASIKTFNAGSESLRRLYPTSSTYLTTNSGSDSLGIQQKPNLYDFNHVRQPLRTLGLPPPSYGAKYQ